MVVWISMRYFRRKCGKGFLGYGSWCKTMRDNVLSLARAKQYEQKARDYVKFNFVEDNYKF